MKFQMLFLDPTTGWFAYCSCLLLILTYCFISPPFLLGNNFQSHIFKRGRGGGWSWKKKECLWGVREFMSQIFAWSWLTIFLVIWDFVSVIKESKNVPKMQHDSKVHSKVFQSEKIKKLFFVIIYMCTTPLIK